MTEVRPFEWESWGGAVPDAVRDKAVKALEAGHVVLLPKLRFELSDSERQFLAPHTVGKSKNVSYDPKSGKVGGAAVAPVRVDELRDVLARFAKQTRDLLASLLPYGDGLKQARNSLRPVEVAGRKQSWRKDDTKLHVDSFPSAPTAGKRILRVFCNVNPEGKPRVWKVGESFDAVAERFFPRLRAPFWGEREFLAAVRATKTYRSTYDHYMLRLHDAMKQDPDYQAKFDASTFAFPAGATWMCFTDQVSHAAVSGCHQFEQTFSLDVAAMRTPQTAPLRVLESIAKRKLA